MRTSIKILCGVSALWAGAAQAAGVCPANHLGPLIAQQSRHEVESGKQLIIVTLGSSSTEGVMATSASSTYPAQLQADLQQLLPKAHIAVINRGIGGQDAPEEIERLDKDAISVNPALVIWQVGANGAMRVSDPEVFRGLVTKGVDRLKAAGIDVILMDNQRSPMVMASPNHTVLEQTLAEIAAKEQISLFSRGALMDEWQKEGAPYEEFVSGDSVHQNDLGYHCVAEALANSLARELGVTRDDTTRMAVNGAAQVSATYPK